MTTPYLTPEWAAYECLRCIELELGVSRDSDSPLFKSVSDLGGIWSSSGFDVHCWPAEHPERAYDRVLACAKFLASRLRGRTSVRVPALPKTGYACRVVSPYSGLSLLTELVDGGTWRVTVEHA